MRFYSIFGLCLLLILSGCAQVPPSVVTVSQSIENDVHSMSEAHTSFVNAYFDALEREITQFIEEKYMPELITREVNFAMELYQSESDKEASIYYAVEEAFVNTENKSKQEIAQAFQDVLDGMNAFLLIINEDVHNRKESLLTPIGEKRRQLLGAIELNYQNIIRKNSTVTGLLVSIVEVHEAQEKMLSELGFEEGLREKVGTSMAELSSIMVDFREQVETKKNSVKEMENEFDSLSSKFNDLLD